MNFPDLGAALTLLTCGIGSGIASYSGGAPIWVSLGALILGFCFGLLGAFLTGNAAYRLFRIRSQGFAAMLNLIVYYSMPIVGVLVFGGISMGVTVIVIKSLGYEAIR